MKIIYILIFGLIIIIIYLHKQKLNQELNQEMFDTSSSSFSQEGLFNLLSSYNSMQIDNKNLPVNNIIGSLDLNGTINISNNITVPNIKTTDLSSNKIIAHNINILNIDLSKNKICLRDTLHCIDPNLIKINSINSNNSVYNNMYLPDEQHCEIFEPGPFRDLSHNYIPSSILSQFGYGKLINSYATPARNDISGNIDISGLPKLAISNVLTGNYYITGTTATAPPFSFPKPAYYFLPSTATSSIGTEQKDYDNSVGFKITIPKNLPFTCQVIWIQVPLYNTGLGKNRSFRATYTDINDIDPNLDVVYSTHKSGYTNYYMPDGSDYNSINSFNYYEYTQWVPIPINYSQMDASGSLYLRRNRTEVRDSTINSLFMISGIAFTTNPWNCCKIPAFCIHYNLNQNPNYDDNNISNQSTTYNYDNVTDYVTIDSTLFYTKIPIINNGKDKLLYLNIVNYETVNINLASVYVCNTDPNLSNLLLKNSIFEQTNNYTTLVNNNLVQKLNNFATSYDNPFARFFNSHKNNRYIATIIPSNMITNNFIFVVLQSQITTGSSLSIREIGTHDLFPLL